MLKGRHETPVTFTKSMGQKQEPTVEPINPYLVSINYRRRQVWGGILLVVMASIFLLANYNHFDDLNLWIEAISGVALVLVIVGGANLISRGLVA